MSKNRDTVSPERWAYLKQLKVPAPRLVFVSQCYRQVEHTSAAGVVTYNFEPVFLQLKTPRGHTFRRQEGEQS